MSAFAIFVGCMLAAIALSGIALWLAAKLLKYSRPTFARAVLVAILLFLLNLLLAIPQLVMPAALQLQYGGLALVGQLVLASLIIKRLQQTTTGRAWGGVGFVTASQLIYLVIALFLVRPFLVEAYSIPTNAMSPTLRAMHRNGTCPSCGGQLIIDVPSPETLQRNPQAANDDQPAICANCFRSITIARARLTGPEINGDRIFVAKYLTPRRWDILAFRAKNGDNFVKRLIALPGETVSITRGGKILINGSELGSPPHQPKLTFSWSEREDWTPPSYIVLRPDASLKLAPDEYFVLGNNSTRSYDSRYFGPIKSKEIIGVTSGIYWPLSRLTVFR